MRVSLNFLSLLSGMAVLCSEDLNKNSVDDKASCEPIFCTMQTLYTHEVVAGIHFTITVDMQSCGAGYTLHENKTDMKVETCRVVLCSEDLRKSCHTITLSRGSCLENSVCIQADLGAMRICMVLQSCSIASIWRAWGTSPSTSW